MNHHQGRLGSAHHQQPPPSQQQQGNRIEILTRNGPHINSGGMQHKQLHTNSKHNLNISPAITSNQHTQKHQQVQNKQHTSQSNKATPVVTQTPRLMQKSNEKTILTSTGISQNGGKQLQQQQQKHIQTQPQQQSQHQPNLPDSTTKDVLINNNSAKHSTVKEQPTPQPQSQSQQQLPIILSNICSDSLANTKEKTPMCLVNELARYNKV